MKTSVAHGHASFGRILSFRLLVLFAYHVKEAVPGSASLVISETAAPPSRLTTEGVIRLWHKVHSDYFAKERRYSVITVAPPMGQWWIWKPLSVLSSLNSRLNKVTHWIVDFVWLVQSYARQVPWPTRNARHKLLSFAVLALFVGMITACTALKALLLYRLWYLIPLSLQIMVYSVYTKILGLVPKDTNDPIWRMRPLKVG